jgi:hypothetical protein
MTCVVLTIPDNPQQLASWLEDALTGHDLARVVRELTLLQGRELEPLRPGELAEVLGPDQTQILNAGLQQIPLSRIRQLTARPELLPELQELLLLEGSDYWQQRWQQQALPKSVGEQVTRAPAAKTSTPAVAWLVTLAAAIMLMVGYINWPQSTTTVAQWGWNSPQLLTADRSASEHLAAIATAGEEWFQKKPANAAELKQRISELKQGCERLIAAQHSQLQPADEKWLKDKCQAWLDKINSQLTALQDESKVPAVQQEMDAIVTKLVDTLRKKSQELQV